MDLTYTVRFPPGRLWGDGTTPTARTTRTRVPPYDGRAFQASVVYNPIVYGLSHPHFRSSVRQYISGCTTVGHSHTAEHNCAAVGPVASGRGGHRTAAGKCGASQRFALLANRNRRADNVVELKCVRHRRSTTAVAAAAAAAATTAATAATAGTATATATTTATARPDSISACLDYYSEPDCR